MADSRRTFAVAGAARADRHDLAAGAVVAVTADVAARIEKKLANGIPARARSLFRESWWDAAVDRYATMPFAGIAVDTIDDLTDNLDVDLTDDQRAHAGAHATGSALVLLGNRFTTVRSRIRDLHAQAIAEGWDPGDLADALGLGEDGSGVLSETSADGIGRSLATLIIEAAGVWALRSSDSAATKTWRTTGDNRVRDAHADADGQTVGINETFDIGGYDAMFPGDPDLPADLAIGCRCELEYSVEAGDTTLDLDEEEAMAASAGSLAAPAHPFAVNTGRVTVTVEPTAAEKQALAVFADVPAELHVPLIDVGDVASLTPDARVGMAGAIATVAANTPPLSGTVTGVGWMETEGVTVGLVDCPGLGDLRTALADALYEMAPEPGEFIPALVLTSGSVDATAVAGVPLHFNELRVRAGAETLVFDLLGPLDAGPELVAPEPETPPADEPPPDPVPVEDAPGFVIVDDTVVGQPIPVPEPRQELHIMPPTATGVPPAEWRLTGTSANGVTTNGHLVFAPTTTEAYADPAAENDATPDGPPPPAITDIPDEDLEAEIARRAAIAAGGPDGADALMADATEEAAGLIAEIAAELAAPDPGESDPPVPPAPGAVAGTEPTTLAVGDLAPDTDTNGIGEAPTVTDYDWEGILAIEGVPTSDGRMFAEGALAWRTLPITLALQTVTAPGHDGAVVCGSICEIERIGPNIIGRGKFSSTEAGELARTLIGEGSLHGVSIDVAAAVVVYTNDDGDEIDDMDAMFGGATMAVFTQAEMMGATLTPFPAFADARVDLLDAPTSLVASGAAGCWRFTGPARFRLIDSSSTEALVASAAPTVPAPPASLFALKPDTREPFSVGTPLPDGTIPVYGLLADWNIPHIGFDGRKVYAPRGDDFALFYTGKHVVTREGDRIPTGPIFVDTVHPNLAANASDAQAWYAHDGAAVADVHLYNAEHGIVAAGCIRPGTDELREYRFRGSDVSPDWRPINGQYRMVAILAVNASGFPVPYIEGIAASAGRLRSWVAYDDTTGEPLAMVAVGAPPRQRRPGEEVAELRAQVAAGEARLKTVEAQMGTVLSVLASLPGDNPDVPDAPVEPDVPAEPESPVPGDEDGPVELSAEERLARIEAARAGLGLDRASRAARARAALGLAPVS